MRQLVIISIPNGSRNSNQKRLIVILIFDCCFLRCLSLLAIGGRSGGFGRLGSNDGHVDTDLYESGERKKRKGYDQKKKQDGAWFHFWTVKDDKPWPEPLYPLHPHSQSFWLSQTLSSRNYRSKKPGWSNWVTYTFPCLADHAIVLDIQQSNTKRGWLTPNSVGVAVILPNWPSVPNEISTSCSLAKKSSLVTSGTVYQSR